MNISLPGIKKLISDLLGRYHLVIFVTVVVGALVFVILMLNGIIIQSGEAGDYVPEGISTSFDQATIDRIEQLKTRDEKAVLDLGTGRSNPFVE